jgi:hypothetical protein
MLNKGTSITRSLYILIAVIWLLTSYGCERTGRNGGPYHYGTESDAAREYFFKGWEEILDNGRWTASEAAFRKAVALDPEWLLGKSLIARITRDAQEKEQLLKDLQLNITAAGPEERKLLEVNMLSIAASVNRDRGISNTQEFNERRRDLAEKNFGEFIRKYPEDDYFKAEYIEFLHANHGARTALDSLNALATKDQMSLGFFISYKATLELELGNTNTAIELSEQLNQQFDDPGYTSPLMLKAQIYMAQDSLLKASALVDKVVAMEPNHLIAHGMQQQLQKVLGDH